MTTFSKSSFNIVAFFLIVDDFFKRKNKTIEHLALGKFFWGKEIDQDPSLDRNNDSEANKMRERKKDARRKNILSKPRASKLRRLVTESTLRPTLKNHYFSYHHQPQTQWIYVIWKNKNKKTKTEADVAVVRREHFHG